MLKNFLTHGFTHGLSGKEGIYWDGEVTQKRSKQLVDCVKISPSINNIKKIQMCIRTEFRRYFFVYQWIAQGGTSKFYKRSKCHRKRWEEDERKEGARWGERWEGVRRSWEEKGWTVNHRRRFTYFDVGLRL